MMNPFICGKYVSETGVHALYSLSDNEWERTGSGWETRAGHSPYAATRYFRDAHGVWQALGWDRVPRAPRPVEDQQLINRLEGLRAAA